MEIMLLFQMIDIRLIILKGKHCTKKFPQNTISPLILRKFYFAEILFSNKVSNKVSAK